MYTQENIGKALLKPIALVGMMGVGKTTIGQRLAAALNLAFVDADAEIEQAAGMTIAEIFERDGEAYFRAGERRVISRLINNERKIIATGGGAFICDETRALILEKCTSIWINADINTLVDRLKRRNTRPLLMGKDPQEVVTALLAKRNPIYAHANIHVQSRPVPPETIVKEILKALYAHA
jgi:shikimate kinase